MPSVCLFLIAALDGGLGQSDAGTEPFFLPGWGSPLSVAKARFPALAPLATPEGGDPLVQTQAVNLTFGGVRFRRVVFTFADGGLTHITYEEKAPPLGNEWVQRDAINAALVARFGPASKKDACVSTWATGNGEVTHGNQYLSWSPTRVGRGFQDCLKRVPPEQVAAACQETCAAMNWIFGAAPEIGRQVCREGDCAVSRFRPLGQCRCASFRVVEFESPAPTTKASLMLDGLKRVHLTLGVVGCTLDDGSAGVCVFSKTRGDLLFESDGGVTVRDASREDGRTPVELIRRFGAELSAALKRTQDGGR